MNEKMARSRALWLLAGCLAFGAGRASAVTVNPADSIPEPERAGWQPEGTSVPLEPGRGKIVLSLVKNEGESLEYYFQFPNGWVCMYDTPVGGDNGRGDLERICETGEVAQGPGPLIWQQGQRDF